MGAAVHSAAHRRGTTLPARPWRPMVRRRDLPQSLWAMGLSVSGDQPVRPGHRRACGRETGSSGYSAVFTQALEHGPSPTEVTTDRAPTYPRVLDELLPSALSRHRAVRQQPHRGRPRPPEIPTAAHARAQTAALSASNQRRTRLRLESPSRPLRTRPGHRSAASAHSNLHRTRPRHLIKAAQRIVSPVPAYATEPYGS